MQQYQNLRWLFLTIGLTAVIGLTAMNVYSLYALHESTVQNTVEKQKRQLLEYTNQVRSRFRQPQSYLRQLDMSETRKRLSGPGRFPDELLEIIHMSSNDPIFSEIYLSNAECNACDLHGAPLWRYDPALGGFDETTDYRHVVSDGLAIARTRVNALISEYRWNTRIIFDTHNSMTVALINLKDREVIAYLLFLVDQEYLVNQYMGPKLLETFGTGSDSGITVWLHDWTNNTVLVTTNPQLEYSYQKVDFIQNFPDLLNDWNLKAAFTDNPDIASSRASLTRNLFVLGGAVLLLIGALGFMFITAQRERALAQRQSHFLANVTHELKTPLSVILAAGENLSDGRVKDKNRLKSYGDHIFHESLRLQSMIDRLLDVARSETRHNEPQKKPIDLPAFIEKFLDNKREILRSQEIDIRFSTDNNIPEIYADPADLTSIFENLVDNAIKYSPDKKLIHIRSYNKNNKILVDVKDHGAGIPRKARKHIFDKFYRVEDSLTAHTKGHGLGLSIVKDMITRNGGRVYVESKVNVGSVFTLEFPVKQQHRPSSYPNNNNLQNAHHVS